MADNVLAQTPAFAAVVVPCNQHEVDQIVRNFELWSRPDTRPFSSETDHKPKLILVFNNDQGKKFVSNIRSEFIKYEMGRFFCNLDFFFLNLSGESDLYQRNYSFAAGSQGYKAGPNNQFFETMRLSATVGMYIFLMEVDCIPIRPNWLGRLITITENSERFFVMGSAYRGRGTLGASYARHINGNAVYAVGDPDFQRFIEFFWEPRLREVVEMEDRRIAYDCVLEMIFSRMKSYTPNDTDWEYWKNFSSKFRYCEYIQNISGAIDIDDPIPDLVSQVLSASPETYIIHSQAVASAVNSTAPADWGLKPKSRQANSNSTRKEMGFVSIHPSENVLRDGLKYILNKDSNSHLMILFSSGVSEDTEILSTLTLEADEPVTLSAMLCRHGETPFEGSSPTPISLNKGENVISLSHRFKKSHPGLRLQIYGQPEGGKVRILSARATVIDSMS